MSRSRRQAVQLLALGVLALVLLAAYLLTRPGTSTPEPAVVATSARSGGGTVGSSAKQSTDPASGLRWVEVSALPAQARDTLALIARGGPYPYPNNDDKVFGNLERLLPAMRNGYYREYTVLTPGSPDRGARRIVAGASGEKYYTADHYASFQRIREGG